MDRRNKNTFSARRGQRCIKPADPIAVASTYLDAQADAEWFDAHPGEAERLRPPSPRELKAFGLPADTLVCVVRASDGTQARAFCLPKA